MTSIPIYSTEWWKQRCLAYEGEVSILREAIQNMMEEADECRELPSFEKAQSLLNGGS